MQSTPASKARVKALKERADPTGDRDHRDDQRRHGDGRDRRKDPHLPHPGGETDPDRRGDQQPTAPRDPLLPDGFDKRGREAQDHGQAHHDDEIGRLIPEF